MNRAFVPFIKSMLVAMLAISSVAIAAEENPVAKADPAKGEALFASGDASRNILACVSCHGASGNSTIVQNPKLAGQHEAYIAKQLHDFKGAQRNNAVMTAIATSLSEDDIKNVAAYLDAQTLKGGSAKNKATLDIGKKIYGGGIAEKFVPACAGCHGPNGAGIPAQFARIGGQHQEYTVAQLNSFRAAASKNSPAGARKNSTLMVTIAQRLSDDEIQAVADYVAGLR